MKYVVLIGDGMADYPVDELDGRTPLEAARTPNMDLVAREGWGGRVRTIPESKPPGSDVANLEIMGYDSTRYFTGRGPMEAASQGVELADDEVVFRCNLITRQGEELLDYSAGHISTEEARELIALVSERLGSARVRFHPGVSYRHLAVLADGPERIDTVPPHDIMGQRVEDHLPSGEQEVFIRELMFASEPILAEAEVNRRRIAAGDRPANMIWLWGSGKALRVPSLKNRFGLTGGVISAVDLVNGIGISAGLERIVVPGITGYLDTNYRGKAEYALDALGSMDFVYVHVEAPDEASHNADLGGKIQAIEDFDNEVVGTVLEGLRGFDEFAIMVLPDHYTPLSVRTHTGESVPFAIWGAPSVRDAMTSYSEREAARVGLMIDPGYTLMEKFLSVTAGP